MARLIHSADKRVTQTLASGTIIRQDFRTAVRFVFFDTGNEYWEYATHGGTLFVVLYKGTLYGLTCRHVFKDFSWRQLIVTDMRHGSQIAEVKSIAYPSHPKDAAIDTDLLDVAVICFGNAVSTAFFKDPAYTIDKKTVATSKFGDTLHVAGALKDISEITEDSIAPRYCLLELSDETLSSDRTLPHEDPTLRLARGKFHEPEFANVTGLSGSPVFNVTQRSLCGMAVRGTMNAEGCIIRYVDMFDIIQLLIAVHERQAETYYKKHITKIVKG